MNDEPIKREQFRAYRVMLLSEIAHTYDGLNTVIAALRKFEARLNTLNMYARHIDPSQISDDELEEIANTFSEAHTEKTPPETH